MKKVESGSGATDFGASMTPEERGGRSVVKSVDGWIPPHDDELLAEQFRVTPKLNREKLAHLIHAELVRHDVSIGKFTSIGFTPDWIDAAADAIIEEYG